MPIGELTMRFAEYVHEQIKNNKSIIHREVSKILGENVDSVRRWFQNPFFTTTDYTSKLIWNKFSLNMRFGEVFANSVDLSQFFTPEKLYTVFTTWTKKVRNPNQMEKGRHNNNVVYEINMAIRKVYTEFTTNRIGAEQINEKIITILEDYISKELIRRG